MNSALALENNDLEHIKYLKELHGNSKGWITKVQKEDNNFKQWHYRFKNLLNEDFNNKNTYISMSTYFSTYRRTEYIKELKALFIDLDTYKTGFTKEQVLMNLEDNYYKQSIPVPNFVIDSGRGLYLVWLINSVPSKALPLWRAVEDYLYKQLKEFGADRQALDATRILRVPGSINSKSNTEVKIIDVNEYVHDLREIQNEYLPELVPSKKKKGRPKKIVFTFRERSLYYARIQDIAKICELREYDLKGHRELILFLYRYYLCSFTNDVEKALEDVLGLNSTFTYPLSENEVTRATRSAETCYLKEDKQYKYKNDTLIELLEISEEEQKHMTTIISNDEYKRRENIRRKKNYKKQLRDEGKISKKEQIIIQRQKIKSLIQQGFSQKDIRNQLNIPSRTIERRVKELRTLQEIV